VHRPLLRALDVPAQRYADIRLGSPRYLVADRRRSIIETRDRYGRHGWASGARLPVGQTTATTRTRRQRPSGISQQRIESNVPLVANINRK
jgi:hypothetical protein